MGLVFVNFQQKATIVFPLDVFFTNVLTPVSQFFITIRNSHSHNPLREVVMDNNDTSETAQRLSRE